MAKKKAERLFTNRERKVFRKFIPKGETVFGGFFIAVIIAATWWFFAQKGNFDPNERDISMETMIADSVSDTLYRTPFQQWVDPSVVHASVGGAPVLADTGVFPADILAGHWEMESRVETFPADRMWEKINGAAEQYIQYGCKNLHYVALEKQGEDLGVSIEMYDMGAFENALGIFGAQRDEYVEVSSDGPLQFYPTSAGAIGVAGPFYIKVVGNEIGEEYVRKGEQLVRAIANMDAAKAGLPKALQVFSDTMEIPFSQIAFEKSDVFQYGFASNFWFAQPDANKDMKFFVHEGASEEEVQKLFALLIENFLYDYEEVSKTEDSVLLKHMFLDVYLAFTRSGTTLFGIDGIESVESVEAQMAVLKGAFVHEEG
jgi:hypothetical protein